MVARLTPDQKVACSSHVVVTNFFFFFLFCFLVNDDKKIILRTLNLHTTFSKVI